MPEIISQFHERYPKVNLELHQGTSEQIEALVAENRVDFAIATDSRSLFPELNLLPCFHWDRIVLTKKDHPLAVPASPSLLAVRDLICRSDVVLALGTEIGRTDYDFNDAALTVGSAYWVRLAEQELA